MADNNQKQKKTKDPAVPKSNIREKLTALVGKDLADTLVTQIIPESVRIGLSMFPDSWFEEIFAKRQLLWKIAPVALGLAVRTFTNLPKLADEVITEVAREISQQIEFLVLKKSKDGKVGPDGKKLSEADKKTIDAVEVTKIISAAQFINNKPGFNGWAEFRKLKTYYATLSKSDKERFLSMFSEMSPIDYIGFMTMTDTERDEFLSFFLKLPVEASKIDVVKAWLKKTKGHISVVAKKVDDTLAKDQPLGIAIRNLFRIPNSN